MRHFLSQVLDGWQTNERAGMCRMTNQKPDTCHMPVSVTHTKLSRYLAWPGSAPMSPTRGEFVHCYIMTTHHSRRVFFFLKTPQKSCFLESSKSLGPWQSTNYFFTFGFIFQFLQKCHSLVCRVRPSQCFLCPGKFICGISANSLA